MIGNAIPVRPRGLP